MGTSGVGKPHYRDRCAAPLKQGERICKVDYTTCPLGTSAGEYDTCANTTETVASQQRQQQQAKATTYSNCKCRDLWWYAYADGSVEGFSGCANPDGDALGAWCAVDPQYCDNYAGEIKQAVNEVRIYLCVCALCASCVIGFICKLTVWGCSCSAHQIPGRANSAAVQASEQLQLEQQ
eukprot:GHUV01035193.1.p1 GENE.GHUV01035193.1~~GHUV01035193.1.p1  ORF type:complete len:178 (+),score=32.42 GHUV01035193.1:535-1068(+)